MFRNNGSVMRFILIIFLSFIFSTQIAYSNVVSDSINQFIQNKNINDNSAGIKNNNQTASYHISE